MPDSPEPPDWIVEQPGLTVFALLSGLLALFVLLPYLQYVLFGVVLAYILLPVQQRLEQYIRPTFAAITVVITTLLVVLIPLVYVISVAVRQSLGLVRSIRQGEIDVETVEGSARDQWLCRRSRGPVRVESGSNRDRHPGSHVGGDRSRR